MRKFSVTNSALWGLVIGALCMLAIIVVTGRARSVPMAGYMIDLLGGAVAGAGSFSLLAWLYNLIMRTK